MSLSTIEQNNVTEKNTLGSNMSIENSSQSILVNNPVIGSVNNLSLKIKSFTKPSLGSVKSTALSIPDFNLIKTSTKTIIAVTNTIFNLNLLFNNLPITPYIVVQKKRGRKKKTDIVDPNKNIPPGSIISVQSKTNVRGVLVKPRKKESKTYFLNSITIVLILNHGKMINTKISQNGKFQITGCKDDSHFIDCLTYLYKHMNESQKYTGESIYQMKPKYENQNPRAIFNVVMKNIDFKVGFPIQRDKLDTFINNNTDFFSLFESSINTGVNIKIKSTKPYDSILTCLEIPPIGHVISTVPYSDYLSFLDDKEKKKEISKEKFHTLLMFQSGACIQSGSGPEMEDVFKKFLSIMYKYREVFEEKLEPEEIDE